MSEIMELVEPESSVKVAVRIRPQNSREIIDMCRICTSVTPKEPQIVLGSDKAFTFDFVFDVNSNQDDIYNCCAEKLVAGALNGYNATVLAYGQTGSGKTFTMGTGFEHDICDEQIGIIPRAICNIFSGIENQRQQYGEKNVQFCIAIQFMELYNEDIIDLLDPYNKSKVYKIHEDSSGQISISGITTKPIYSPQDALKYLRQGALARSTASTQMNDQSSRSHALFTILIRKQQFVSSPESSIKDDMETLTSKFHFVDLAGSERLKRTGATGERAREGISINCGLLALGNCISALGDKSKKATHIPYRDSKLTRLLQDSLGGNSQTLMIACVSPSDRDFMETLNTLKYANRAKNIKNKVQLNQDKNSRTISQLRGEIATLQLELLEFKQGKRFVDKDGVSSISDTFHENILLNSDNKRLQCRIKAMQETINILSENNAHLKIEKEIYKWSQQAHNSGDVKDIVSGYVNEIEKLQAKLIESEEMYKCLKNQIENETSQRGANKRKFSIEDATDVIMMAKMEIEKEINSFSTQAQTYNTDLDIIQSPSNDDIYLSGESDGETEYQKKIQADLLDINSNIEMKTKLLEQLELSQQRLQLMRQHYEEKLAVLQCTIANTQKERDEVLSSMTKNNSNQPNDRTKKIRDEYERKLTNLQREVKKLQQAEREHLKQQRHLKTQEIQLRNLQNELNELKFIKTRLMRKMSDQFKCHKEAETKKSREILQLRKEQRKQENTVRSLQAKMIAKEQILKRKNEEVSVLRRNQRLTSSQRAKGRTIHKNQTLYNSKLARQKWESFRRGIIRAARSKHVVLQLDKELNRLISERDSLCYTLKNIQYRQDANDSFDLCNEEDTIKSNLCYVQDNITHIQQSILELEDGKDSCGSELQYLHDFIGSISNIDEAKFLIECLIDNDIAIICNSILCENQVAEQKTLLKQVEQESNIQQQLLQYFLAQNSSFEISNVFETLNLGCNAITLNTLSRSQHSVNSSDTYDIPSSDRIGLYPTHSNKTSRSPSPAPTIDLNPKVRKRTAHPEDLLFGDGDDTNEIKSSMTRSFQQISSNVYPLTRIPSAPGSLK